MSAISGLVVYLWHRFQPTAPQHRSREAYLEHCRKTGKNPAGDWLSKEPDIPASNGD